MNKSPVLFFLLLFSLSSSFSQEHPYIKQLNSDNELKFALTYLTFDKIETYDTEDGYFIKIFQIDKPDYVLLQKETKVLKSYFYIVVGSYNETSHLEAKLYKTIDFINPFIKHIKLEDSSKHSIEFSSLDYKGTDIINHDKQKKTIITLSKYEK